MGTDQVIDHSGCVEAGIHTVDAHTHEGQTGFWLFRDEAVSRGTLKHSLPFVQVTGVPPCPAGELYTAVVYGRGGEPHGEHDGQRCQHGQRKPPIQFPVMSTHDRALLLQFITFEERTEFKEWLLRIGWEAFNAQRR